MLTVSLATLRITHYGFGCRTPSLVARSPMATTLLVMLLLLILMPWPREVLATDPSNLSTEKLLRDAMNAIVQDAIKENITPTPNKKTEKKQGVDSSAKMCRKIGEKLRSVTLEECLKFDLLLTNAHSVNGLPLLIKEYLPQSNRVPQARILLLGGIHGDEYSSVSIVFKWLEILEKHHSGMFHWRIVPLVNPDGLLMTKSQRTNQNGVDLNRNFPTADWRRESREYWINKTHKDPRRYPGPAPLSEPESRWIAEEIERFRPHVIVAIHAPFGLLDFDGPPTIPPEKLGALYLNPLGTYPGSLGRYAGIQKRLPIITIELPFAGIMPTQGETLTIWSDLIQWIRGHIHDRKIKPLQKMEH